MDDSEQNLITFCSACHPTVHHGVPCLTLRSNTERPVTVTMGTGQTDLSPRKFQLTLSRRCPMK